MARPAAALPIALVLCALALLGAGPVAASDPPSPPAQPASGPGGAAAKWESIRQVLHDDPDDNLDYWTMEPRGWTSRTKDRPDRLPTTFFLHGYGAMDPVAYRTWIDHIVKRGNIVVYPRYQANLYVPPPTYTDNAMTALERAVRWLRRNAEIPPRLGDGVNLIGHSYGGAVATNVAGRAVAAGLPKPASLLLVNPFVENAGYRPPVDAMDADLTGIPPGTEFDCIVADIDAPAGRLGCDEAWSRTRHLKPGKRNYIWMFGDDHGEPPLAISHRGPSIATPTDAFDWFGFWKLGDALTSCSLDGRNCEYALGNTREQRWMGAWSDGVAVRKLDVFRKPPPCPPGTQAYGC